MLGAICSPMARKNMQVGSGLNRGGPGPFTLIQERGICLLGSLLVMVAGRSGLARYQPESLVVRKFLQGNEVRLRRSALVQLLFQLRAGAAEAARPLRISQPRQKSWAKKINPSRNSLKHQAWIVRKMSQMGPGAVADSLSDNHRCDLVVIHTRYGEAQHRAFQPVWNCLVGASRSTALTFTPLGNVMLTVCGPSG